MTEFVLGVRLFMSLFLEARFISSSFGVSI
jgi:hypothetical protein